MQYDYIKKLKTKRKDGEIWINFEDCQQKPYIWEYNHEALEDLESSSFMKWLLPIFTTLCKF